MRNLVKTTVLGLGLVVTMSSCTKDNQEMIELSEKKEVIIPIEKKPTEEKELTLPIPSLPETQPTPTPTPSGNTTSEEVISDKELDFTSRKQSNTNFKKVSDMGIMRETPAIEILGNQNLSPKNK